MKAIGLILLCVLISVTAEKARFDFYRLYDILPENDVHLQIFKEIYDYPDGFRFVTNPPSLINNPFQLIVPPQKFGEWSEIIEKYIINAKLISNNFQEIIDKADAKFHKRKAFSISEFQPLEDINNWMRSLASNRPNDITIFTVGTSYEGRSILGLKINIDSVTGKESIFFESNIHANEWIGGATTIFIINELLESSDNSVRELLARFEWYFVPILNVDGYVYTWEVDRTWRKTRGPTKNVLCRGADPNRNWDVDWSQYGSSANPCSNGYHGDFVFSEPETLQLARYVNSIPNLFGYISFHSFGQLLMTPYAYTQNTSVNHDLLFDIGRIAVEQLETVRGSQYIVGTINNFFGATAGSSVDYVVINKEPKIVYCYELNNNHILSSEEIQPTGQEIFASLITIFSEAVNRGL